MTADNPIEEYFPSGSDGSGEPVEPSGDAELASLLEEYDRQEAASPDKPDAEPDGNPFAGETDEEIETTLRRYTDAADRMSGVQDQRSDEVAVLMDWAHSVDRERAAQREQRDVGRVMQKAEEFVSDIEGVPPGYAEMYMRAEYSKDPELLAAWNGRYRDERSLRHAEKVVGRKLKKMRAEAKRLPDPNLSADKMAVQRAMRDGSRSGPPPAKAPPDYSGLSDAEFADEIERSFGFRPQV